MRDGFYTPFDCVDDARHAIALVRRNAAEFGVIPDKIVASGGSAGGHVALCTAVFQREGDKMSMPDALVLYNPVVNTSEEGYGKEKFKGDELALSPYHHIGKGLPPVLLFHGTQDRTVPFRNALDFDVRMRQLGNDCTLVPAWGKDHGFFNGPHCRPANGDAFFRLCMNRVATFLERHGFLSCGAVSANCLVPVYCVMDDTAASGKCAAALQHLLGREYNVTAYNVEDTVRLVVEKPSIIVARLNYEREVALLKCLSRQQVKPTVILCGKKTLGKRPFHLSVLALPEPKDVLDAESFAKAIFLRVGNGDTWK